MPEDIYVYIYVYIYLYGRHTTSGPQESEYDCEIINGNLFYEMYMDILLVCDVKIIDRQTEACSLLLFLLFIIIVLLVFQSFTRSACVEREKPGNAYRINWNRS